MIPVVNLSATYSFASQNPVLTGLVILALIAVALFLVWFTRKFPKHQGKLRFGIFAVYLVAAVWVNWGMFKPEPSVQSEIEAAIHRYDQIAENGIEMAMLNDNPTPRAGDRLAFQEIQGDKCRFYGVVQPEGHVAINRRSCADNTQTLISLDIPLDKGVAEASGLKHYRAYLPGRVTERTTQ